MFGSVLSISVLDTFCIGLNVCSVFCIIKMCVKRIESTVQLRYALYKSALLLLLLVGTLVLS